MTIQSIIKNIKIALKLDKKVNDLNKAAVKSVNNEKPDNNGNILLIINNESSGLQDVQDPNYLHARIPGTWIAIQRIAPKYQWYSPKQKDTEVTLSPELAKQWFNKCNPINNNKLMILFEPTKTSELTVNIPYYNDTNWPPTKEYLKYVYNKLSSNTTKAHIFGFYVQNYSEDINEYDGKIHTSKNGRILFGLNTLAPGQANLFSIPVFLYLYEFSSEEVKDLITKEIIPDELDESITISGNLVDISDLLFKEFGNNTILAGVNAYNSTINEYYNTDIPNAVNLPVTILASDLSTKKYPIEFCVSKSIFDSQAQGRYITIEDYIPNIFNDPSLLNKNFSIVFLTFIAKKLSNGSIKVSLAPEYVNASTGLTRKVIFNRMSNVPSTYLQMPITQFQNVMDLSTYTTLYLTPEHSKYAFNTMPELVGYNQYCLAAAFYKKGEIVDYYAYLKEITELLSENEEVKFEIPTSLIDKTLIYSYPFKCDYLINVKQFTNSNKYTDLVFKEISYPYIDNAKEE